MSEAFLCDGERTEARRAGPSLSRFEVEDLAARLEELKAKGVRLINETPIELPGRKMAFIHPKSTGGVLVELYQLI